MGKIRNNSFQDEWENPNICRNLSLWVRKVPNNPHSAACLLCKKQIDISSMGKQALTSHEKSQKHIIAKDISKSNRCISSFSSHKNLGDLSENLVVPSTDLELDIIPDQAASKEPPKTVNNYILDESVIIAEIRWALKCISSHFSYRSCGNIGDIFKTMFSDSAIANKFSMGYTKICSDNHGYLAKKREFF